MARSVFEKRINAVGKLQAWLDGIYRKRQYKKTREKLYLLQAYIKMWLARRNFLKKVEAVTEIARFWRGYSLRNLFARREESSLKISSAVRMMLAFKKFQRQRAAASYIQAKWRGYKARKALRVAIHAANKIAATWKMFVGMHRYLQKRRAGAVLVCAGFMYRHIRLHKSRNAAAKKIAAVWRGYCVRLNVAAMRAAVFKIAKWWDTIKTFQLCSEAIIEVLVEARMVREAMTGDSAAKIQRAWRAKNAGPSQISKMRKAAIKIQSLYRCQQAKKIVDFERAIAGVRLKRYPSKPMVLVQDKKGRLTRSRAPVDDQELTDTKTKFKPIVDFSGLSKTMYLDLDDAVSNLQGHFRLLAKIKAARRIQRLVRGQNERKLLAKKQKEAVKIQAWARARIVRSQVRLMRANLGVMQSHARRYLAKKSVDAEKKAMSAEEEKPAEEQPVEEKQPEEQASEAQPSA